MLFTIVIYSVGQGRSKIRPEIIYSHEATLSLLNARRSNMGAATFSMMTLSVMTLTIMTLSKMNLAAMLSQHNDTWHKQ